MILCGMENELSQEDHNLKTCAIFAEILFYFLKSIGSKWFRFQGMNLSEAVTF